LPIILAPIIEGRADITLGSRFGGKSNAVRYRGTKHSAIASPPSYQAFVRVKVSDLGPFRAGRADVLRTLALEEATYGWAVEMNRERGHRGFRIVEVPVSYHPRIGKSKIAVR